MADNYICPECSHEFEYDEGVTNHRLFGESIHCPMCHYILKDVKHIVVVQDYWFRKHLDIFSNTEYCKVSKTVIEDDLFNDDAIYKQLLSKKKEAEKELRDYEYNKRFNIK